MSGSTLNCSWKTTVQGQNSNVIKVHAWCLRLLQRCDLLSCKVKECVWLLKGYASDAVASALNTLDSSSRKGVQEAVQKAGHSLPAANLSASGVPPRAQGEAEDNFDTILDVALYAQTSCLPRSLQCCTFVNRVEIR